MIAPAIVIALRLIVPVTILRWPLAGALVSVLADGFDVVLVDALGLLTGELGGFGTYYQTMDKWLDMYYLSFEAWVSLRWPNRLVRNTSVFLFVYRFIGLVLFEITGIRVFFFFFPNLFENFFLYYVVVAQFFPRLVPTNLKQLALALFILYVPKFGQEWLLHYQLAQPWIWFKQTVLP